MKNLLFPPPPQEETPVQEKQLRKEPLDTQTNPETTPQDAQGMSQSAQDAQDSTKATVVESEVIREEDGKAIEEVFDASVFRFARRRSGSSRMQF